MSHVTDVVLLMSFLETEHPDEDLNPNGRTHPIIDALNAWCESQRYGSFVRVDHLAGGTKAFQASMYVAAINYLDLPALATQMQALPWESAERVQLLVKREHDETFGLFGWRRAFTTLTLEA